MRRYYNYYLVKISSVLTSRRKSFHFQFHNIPNKITLVYVYEFRNINERFKIFYHIINFTSVFFFFVRFYRLKWTKIRSLNTFKRQYIITIRTFKTLIISFWLSFNRIVVCFVSFQAFNYSMYLFLYIDSYIYVSHRIQMRSNTVLEGAKDDWIHIFKIVVDLMRKFNWSYGENYIFIRLY